MGKTTGSSGNRCVRARAVRRALRPRTGIRRDLPGCRDRRAVLFAADVDGKKPSRQAVAQGRALFEREWQPGDSRTHDGDGLGPVYNDSSCVACHNLGGTGGAGSSGKNVDIITATPVTILQALSRQRSQRTRDFCGRRFDR